jgi:predicted dehydrogenase
MTRDLPDLPQSWPAPAHPRPIVLIGAGGIARDAHLPAYAKAGLPVAALVDTDRAKAEALIPAAGGARVFGDAAEAAAAFGTGAVYDLAVPPDAILPVLSALPEGAAVLIQKPMGRDLAEARAILALCRARRLSAAVNFQLRFAPMMLWARAALAAGHLGEPLEAEVHLNIFTPWQLFPFLLPMPRVEILVHSIHYLDSLRALLGDPRAVMARTLPDPRAEGFAQTRTTAILDWGDAKRGVMSINHNHAFGRRFQAARIRIEGTEGALMMKLGVLYDYPNGEPDELWFCPKGGEWAQVPLAGRWFVDAFMGPMRNLQRHAAGEDAALETDVADAARTMALVEALYAAAARPGEPVPEV